MEEPSVPEPRRTPSTGSVKSSASEGSEMFHMPSALFRIPDVGVREVRCMVGEGRVVLLLGERGSESVVATLDLDGTAKVGHATDERLAASCLDIISSEKTLRLGFIENDREVEALRKSWAYHIALQASQIAALKHCA